MPLAQRSLSKLDGVHPDLISVVTKASEKCDFLVTEGRRTKDRQAMLVKTGKSQTLNSRHLYGLAVDLCDTDGCYDLPDMYVIAKAIKSAAIELDIPIQWGGDWKSFKDTPHFELDRKTYPDNGEHKPHVYNPKTIEKFKGVVAGTAGAATAVPYIPAPPDLSKFTQWQGAGEQIASLGAWAASRPLLTAGLVSWVAVIALWNRLPWGKAA